MTQADGRIIGKTKILDNGENWRRFDLVILGDGYLATQMPRFEADAKSFLDHLLATPPFDWLKPAMNVWRIDVASDEEGADDPGGACGGTGAAPRTYFDATFCSHGAPRLLDVDRQLALDVATSQVTNLDAIIVIVNSTKYGGSGGCVAVFSRDQNGNEIGLHELGHSAFGLADEYPTWSGCDVDKPGDRDRHPGHEPPGPNATVETDPAKLKWRDLILRGTPVPTTRNPDCGTCDTQPNPVDDGVVGAFEGAATYHCGAYRPVYDCKMRTGGRPFCPVCQRAIERKLMPFVDYQTLYAIESAAFPGVYLRMDAEKPGGGGAVNTPGGVVNCQGTVGEYEKFYLRWRETDFTYAIESKAWGRWVRMDGSGVTAPVGEGGGTVNCTPWLNSEARFKIVPNMDGTVSFESLKFPHVFLRMDGRGVTGFEPEGAGLVNCQATIAPWEKFRLRPLPRQRSTQAAPEQLSR